MNVLLFLLLPLLLTQEEKNFQLSVWREKTVGKVQDREIKIGEILDYIQSHYSPTLGKELDSSYGYFQLNSPDFDRWVEDYLDLQILSPMVAKNGLSVSKAEVEALAKERAQAEQKKYLDKKQLDPSSANAVLPSLVSRTLRNQGLALEKKLLLEKFFPRPVPNVELRAFFVSNAARFGGAVRASQILFSTVDPKTGRRYSKELRDSLRKSAEDLLQKLRDGQDFAEAAKLYSDEESTKKKGGDMDYFRRTDPLPEALTRAAFTTTPGQTVGPIQTELGFHLLLVKDKRVSKHPEFQQIKSNVEDDYIREQSAKLLEKLRNEAKLELY